MRRVLAMAALGLALSFALAACAAMGYRPPPGDLSGPIHGDPGGSGM